MTNRPQVTILQELATQVRSKTIYLLENTPDRDLLWSAPGTSNHIIWHAGHAIWLADALCLELIVGRSMLPPSWAGFFGANCRPVSQTPTWPAKAQMLSQLRAQLKAIISELGKLVDDDLDRVVGGSTKTTLGERIIHAFHDEANHQGEIHLLQKMRRPHNS